ncbi:MAG TPA: CBS domain-containing protein [Phycisphaerae bacterium]|nr:CBS domain-containing protein [Phycisphaerae bacterium]
MLVNDYMTPDPLTVSTDERVERIAELIRAHGIRQVPVVDNAHRLVGIVTDRDLRSAGGFDRKAEAQLVAEDVMSTNLVTIIPGADLAEAAHLLYEHRVGALPVVMGEHVVGMLSTRDLLRRLIELSEENVTLAAHHYDPAYPF